MKIEVNGAKYDIEIIQEKITVNGRKLVAKLNDEDQITIRGKTFYLDFAQQGEEGDPSLMIVNGMIYLISKSSLSYAQKEIKAPISGKVKDVFAKVRSQVKEGQVLATIEAMKMEIQIKSPSAGTIKEIKAYKDQSVKTGDILVTFE